jgi:hypothetical protein
MTTSEIPRTPSDSAREVTVADVIEIVLTEEAAKSTNVEAPPGTRAAIADPAPRELLRKRIRCPRG